MGFVTTEDHERELKVAALLEKAWDCKVHKYAGEYDPVDFWIERNGVVVAFAELKSRFIPSTKYKTVFLSARKYLDMMLLSMGRKVAVLFIVQFTDCIKYLDVRDLTNQDDVYTVCERLVQRVGNDTEPVMEVPIADMKLLPP